jgi:hypothetical protein
MRQTLPVLIFLLLLPGSISAQRAKNDSLLLLIQNDKPDTEKVNHLYTLGLELFYSNGDTAMIIFNEARAKGISIKI